MRLADLDRFRGRAVLWSLRLFGAALLAEVAIEARSGVWRVHEGVLYPWRHLPILPLYPTWALALEWVIALATGLALALLAGSARVRRIALPAAAAITLVSVLERYSNHGALLFLVALYFAMAPRDRDDLGAPSFDARCHPTLGLVRAQLVVVYVFSALNKVTHGFLSGASLANLLGWPVGLARAASLGAVVAELALPLLLYWRPRAGVAGVVVLHLAFSLFLSNLGSFALAMLAAAVLFL